MKIKKFEGAAEQEVIERVRDELGLQAVILNIKKVQPRGVFGLFRKSFVEVTAAYEEEAEANTAAAAIGRTENVVRQDKLVSELEAKLRELEAKRPAEEKSEYAHPLIRHFRDSLIRQEVLPEIADEIFGEFRDTDADEQIDVSLIVKLLYNAVSRIIGQPEPITVSPGSLEGKLIVLMGPTGVGKTTTIAKLCADFALNQNAGVSLITADTYRVAAVEQLKTYADILSLDVGVVYSSKDMERCLETMRHKSDVILVDTAGRSHKNAGNMGELKALLDLMPHSERYLTVSLSTRWEDMRDLAAAYAPTGDFGIILTKFDETSKYGDILNLCRVTGKKLSYVTTGQNVPDDIVLLKPEVVAKALLGLGLGDSV